MAQKDPKIILITGDLGFGVFNDFRKKLPGQFLNAGVAEQNMTGLATGMALEGFKIFTYSIANFPILRCLEQVRNDACYHHANINIVSIGGGFSYGSLGFSHHATEDISIMRSLPEITVLAPGDLWETEQVTQSIPNIPGTCYLRLDKSDAGWTQQEGEQFKVGKARELRAGDDFTLISTGGILEDVLKATDILKEKGISCRVLSVHTLKPLDEESILHAARTTGGILTIEEHTVLGGLGGAVAEICLESGEIPKAFYRIGLRDRFSTIVGSQPYLRERYKMDVKSIVKKVEELLKFPSSG